MATTKKTNVKKTTAKKTVEKKVLNLDAVEDKTIENQEKTLKEIELENKIVKLEEALSKLIADKEESPKEEVLDANRDILFVSLCYGILNLSTGKNGDGEVYTFNEIGEEQLIPMADAKAIVKTNRNFIKNGKVFIDDEEFIKKERLDAFYKNILDWKGLQDLFNKDSNTFEIVYRSIPESQQLCFKDMLSEKILKGQKVDRNLVYIVNEVLGIDIMKKIDEGKDLK